VDNGSTDNTYQIAKHYTKYVVKQNIAGYGNACLAGVSLVNLLAKKHENFVCFFDADGQSAVNDIIRVCNPVIQNKVDYCQGTRIKAGKSTLHGHAYVANKFFSLIISLIWKRKITDLGPLRCLKLSVLNEINMSSRRFAWTIEMNTKIAKSLIKQLEVAVEYHPRVKGKSKISGNVRSSFKALAEMTLTLFKVSFFWKLKKVHYS
jgi:glycosyltransferase involved in cell wall biosynthesis